jgi:sugar lactone lactonase YvrE
MGGRVRHCVIVALALIGTFPIGCGRGEAYFPSSLGSTTGSPGDVGSASGTSGGVTSSGPGTNGSTGGMGTSTATSATTTTGGSPVPGVTTLAGNGTPGTGTFADGSGGPTGQAEFSGPEGIAVDGAGNVYVADSLNYRVRKIDPSGNVTTLAGNGIPGNKDGTGGPSGTAQFNFPSGTAVDRFGNVFVADANNNRIARIDPQGNVTTIAARGLVLYVLSGVAVDRAENLFLTDTKNNRVLEIDPMGNVTTVAGNGTQGHADGTGGPDGTATFDWPTGVAIDTIGNLYVADFKDCRIRKIDLAHNVTTVAGNGVQGFADGSGGPKGTAEFESPAGIAIDQGGNLYVGDAANNRVRRIDQSGNVTTLAGNGIQGFADGSLGPLGNAEFHDPAGVAVDLFNVVYVADSQNNRIRKIVQ